MEMKVREFETRMQSPTPYPDVNALLRDLLADAQAILKDNFVGMYLHGSLASGDFDPQRSDIDFVIVTADKLPAEMVSALEALHARMTASGAKWAAKLEGTYIPQGALRRYNPEDGPFPCINEGKFYMARHESHWVLTRHILREQGVVIAGPEPRSLIEPVHPDDLRRAVKEFLREWWSPIMEMPARLQSSEYQAYTVLTMCRVLYTLQYDTVVSKPAAARWAQNTLGERWTVLIEWALAWPPDTTSDNMNETLDFIRYTLERSRHFETTAEDG